MNEMTRLERFRSEIPLPDLTDLRAEEGRLLDAIVDPASLDLRPADRPRRVRRLRLGLAAGLAAAVVTAGGVAVSARKPPGSPVVHTMPAAVVQVLDQAVDNVAEAPELHPRTGQFLVFESQTMNTVEGGGNDGQSRYLTRERRTIWLPVEGDATHGVLETEVLAPKPYPGWPIPPEARAEVGARIGPRKAVDVDGTAEWLRNDYAHLSHLPTDPAKMYEHLYTHLGNGPGADVLAWQRIGNMLTEAYMPAAQRAALFRAAAAIHGVTTVGQAVDAAGRTGIAVALAEPALGVRHEYIFDRKTYQYLGERSTVTDAARAKAPVGSVLTSTAQLKVWATGHAPTVNKH
jgi:hypothetical protein